MRFYFLQNSQILVVFYIEITHLWGFNAKKMSLVWNSTLAGVTFKSDKYHCFFAFQKSSLQNAVRTSGGSPNLGTKKRPFSFSFWIRKPRIKLIRNKGQRNCRNVFSNFVFWVEIHQPGFYQNACFHVHLHILKSGPGRISWFFTEVP